MNKCEHWQSENETVREGGERGGGGGIVRERERERESKGEGGGVEREQIQEFKLTL